MTPRVLLTGASGYVGSRLLRDLEAGGCPVRCLARRPARVMASRSTTEVVTGDCLDAPSLDAAMTGIDQAFYLVHSMSSGAGFAALDREAAANFGRAARKAGVRRIIYLGGLADDAGPLSAHLKSRLETGAALRDSRVPVVEFRASIVIGAGSLSFEMIRALVERLPAMICPRWVDTRTQPIAVDDVLAYLRAALDLPNGAEGVFEIGGPEVVSYGEMMREYARLRGLRRALIPVPVLTPRLSGLWLGLVTPAQARVGRALVEGLRNPTVLRSSTALETFAIRPMTLREAFVRAIDDGGASGCYLAEALWRLRGWINRILGGTAMPRFRRQPEQGSVDDVVDRSQELCAFTYGSIVSATPGEVFRWHEQPGALAALTPAALVRIDEQEGGIRDGGRVTVSVGFGRARLRWSMRHYGYIAGRRFCDEQVAGPFAAWRHTHLFEPLGSSQTLYEDRIEFAVARRRVWNRLAAIVLRPLLRCAFAHRHRIVRSHVGSPRPRATSRWAAAAALAAATTLLPTVTPAQTMPVRTVPFVDLSRYAGDWFEIARYPNRFQRACVGDVRATYARRPDGRVDVVNRCRAEGRKIEARGVARIVDERTFAKLKVRFAPAWLSWLPMTWGDYWVIGLAPDYSWVVVGDPDREYLWILARAPRLDDASIAAAQAAARDNGFDVSRLVPTSQADGDEP